ncbi:Bsp6I family type II restriction endonuclease [Empedobacter falsenii]|uniref:Bsp6I family type II restriction endonuclease n=1 Tax=Algoriella xinjiangensis TaxID=684065 RepID=UPI000F64447A|nr:Bsp6I family type II restriction endonuclease [Algoriella xinjiangensis]VDH16688.1 Bsp6I restriction endonuclease [Algoriella xinjiangensis]
MKQEIRNIKLPEGDFQVSVDIFTKEDLKLFQEIYQEWRSLSNKLNSIKARSINLPEGLSEGSFCLFTSNYRLNNPKFPKSVHSSFDSYDPKTHKRIQVKACSVIPDLTSFGPKSVWDELYFLDFYRDGSWDGKYDVYHIPNDLIYGTNVNKNFSFAEMQGTGKRPRFSIYKDIIQTNQMVPVATFDLFDERTILNKLPFYDKVDDEIIIGEKGEMYLK